MYYCLRFERNTFGHISKRGSLNEWRVSSQWMNSCVQLLLQQMMVVRMWTSWSSNQLQVQYSPCTIGQHAPSVNSPTRCVCCLLQRTHLLCCVMLVSGGTFTGWLKRSSMSSSNSVCYWTPGSSWGQCPWHWTLICFEWLLPFCLWIWVNVLEFTHLHISCWRQVLVCDAVSSIYRCTSSIFSSQVSILVISIILFKNKNDLTFRNWTKSFCKYARSTFKWNFRLDFCHSTMMYVLISGVNFRCL